MLHWSGRILLSLHVALHCACGTGASSPSTAAALFRLDTIMVVPVSAGHTRTNFPASVSHPLLFSHSNVGDGLHLMQQEKGVWTERRFQALEVSGYERHYRFSDIVQCDDAYICTSGRHLFAVPPGAGDTLRLLHRTAIGVDRMRGTRGGVDLMTCAYRSRAEEPHSLSLQRYHPEGQVLDTALHLPEPDDYMLTLFQPRWIVDVTDSLIAVSSVSRYEVVLYDRRLHRLDTLGRTPAWWRTRTDWPRFDTLHLYHPKEIISRLRPFLSTVSTIRFVSFINDSTLIVESATPGSYGHGLLENQELVRRFDIWRQSDRGWDPVAIDHILPNPSLDDSISTETPVPIPFDYRMERNSIVATEQLPVPSYGRTWREVIDESERYAADHPLLPLSIMRFTYVGP